MNSVLNEQILAEKLSKLNTTQQCIESKILSCVFSVFRFFFQFWICYCLSPLMEMFVGTQFLVSLSYLGSCFIVNWLNWVRTYTSCWIWLVLVVVHSECCMGIDGLSIFHVSVMFWSTNLSVNRWYLICIYTWNCILNLLDYLIFVLRINLASLLSSIGFR